jgi:DNA-binding MarR family transcriptional regulator
VGRSPAPARELPTLERIVVASVAITARALAEVAPELTFVQWRVLVLVDRPEGIAVGALATALGSKMAAMSRLVGRLRARDLVDAHRGEDDARLVLVTLTTTGAELRSRVVERRRDELRAALALTALPADARRVMERVAAALEETG